MKFSKIIFGVGLFFGLAKVAFAAIEVGDFLKEGDNLIIHDTYTGLYWLKTDYIYLPSKNTSLTPNRTYREVETRLQDSTDDLYGFRHASIEDVKTLIDSFGISIPSACKFTPADIQTLALTEKFISMFGATYKTADGRKKILSGYTSTTCAQSPTSLCSAPGTSNKHHVALVGFNLISTSPQVTLCLTNNRVIGEDQAQPDIGHFLITNYNPTKLVK